MNTPVYFRRVRTQGGACLLPLLISLFALIALAALIRFYLVHATVVDGQSMQPNLKPAERLIVERLSYYFRQPRHNDVVMLEKPDSPAAMIKRIVGLPGETIEIKEGHVFVDEREVAPPYDIAPRWRIFVEGDEVKAPTKFGDSHSTYGPVTLAEDMYFVLGDNRDNSNDSRAFGPVHRNTIKGRVWMRYWPLARMTIFNWSEL